MYYFKSGEKQSLLQSLKALDLRILAWFPEAMPFHGDFT